MAKNMEDTALACARSWDWKAPRKRATKPEHSSGQPLSDLWTYSANRVPEISDSIVELDRAMRLGFNWELGPFELWTPPESKPPLPA